MTASVRRSILALLIESGFQVTPDALDYILTLESPIEKVESVLLTKFANDSPLVLSKDYIISIFEFRSAEQNLGISVPDKSSESKPKLSNTDKKGTV